MVGGVKITGGLNRFNVQIKSQTELMLLMSYWFSDLLNTDSNWEQNQ